MVRRTGFRARITWSGEHGQENRVQRTGLVFGEHGQENRVRVRITWSGEQG
jgi:hypothetical protein